MKKAFIIMTFSAMAAGCADNSIPKAQLPELDTSNPLLAEWNTPHQTPPFSEIELSDYEPAFDAAIACSHAEIDAIVANPSKPTFGNTIVALERHGALLDRISGIFFNLLEADTSDEMQQIALRVQPKLTELSNDISLNPELFARVKAVYGKPGRGLSKEDKKLLEDTYQSFARNGAALSDADKELYRKYSSELSAATLQFGQNALAATNAFSLNITDPKVVAELPDFVKEGMAADAKARGEKGWTVTLQAPSYVPFLTYSSNRALKEKLWRAYNSRALGGENDNTLVVKQIANTRTRTPHTRVVISNYSPTYVRVPTDRRVRPEPNLTRPPYGPYLPVPYRTRTVRYRTLTDRNRNDRYRYDRYRTGKLPDGTVRVPTVLPVRPVTYR